MALHFLTSSTESIDVVVTCDSSVEATEDQRSAYLNSGSLDDLGKVKEDATKAEIKRAFGKSIKGKKMNKKILSEFIELVA